MVIIDILSTTSWSSVFVVQWPVGRLMWYVDLCIHSAHCNEKWACIASKMTATRAKGAATYRANALGTIDSLYHPKSIDIHKLHMMNIGTKQQMTWDRIERRIAQFHAASSDSMIHCVSNGLCESGRPLHPGLYLAVPSHCDQTSATDIRNYE